MQRGSARPVHPSRPAPAGQNAPLVAGWGGTSMLRALELLKYT